MSINSAPLYDWAAWINLAPEFDWDDLHPAPTEEPVDPEDPEAPAAGE